MFQKLTQQNSKVEGPRKLLIWKRPGNRREGTREADTFSLAAHSSAQSPPSKSILTCWTHQWLLPLMRTATLCDTHYSLQCTQELHIMPLSGQKPQIGLTSWADSNCYMLHSEVHFLLLLPLLALVVLECLWIKSFTISTLHNTVLYVLNCWWC